MGNQTMVFSQEGKDELTEYLWLTRWERRPVSSNFQSLGSSSEKLSKK